MREEKRRALRVLKKDGKEADFFYVTIKSLTDGHINGTISAVLLDGIDIKSGFIPKDGLIAIPRNSKIELQSTTNYIREYSDSVSGTGSITPEEFSKIKNELKSKVTPDGNWLTLDDKYAYMKHCDKYVPVRDTKNTVTEVLLPSPVSNIFRLDTGCPFITSCFVTKRCDDYFDTVLCTLDTYSYINSLIIATAKELGLSSDKSVYSYSKTSYFINPLKPVDGHVMGERVANNNHLGPFLRKSMKGTLEQCLATRDSITTHYNNFINGLIAKRNQKSPEELLALLLEVRDPNFNRENFIKKISTITKK